MYLLHDYNLDAVVEGAMVENAKDMLDAYYAKLKGKSLRIAYKNGNVPPHRLTHAFKKEIGLAWVEIGSDRGFLLNFPLRSNFLTHIPMDPDGLPDTKTGFLHTWENIIAALASSASL
jgi:hypothetical protein